MTLPKNWKKVPGYLFYDQKDVYRIRFYHPKTDTPIVFIALALEISGYEVPRLTQIETVTKPDRAKVFVWMKEKRISYELLTGKDLQKARESER